MATVTISEQEFTVYATETEALNYLQGSVGSAADAFRDATSDNQKRALVSATRWIDGQAWSADYDTFEKRLAFPSFVNACIELAAMLTEDADLRTTFQAVQQKRIKAGSVEIENFRGASVEVTTAFPQAIMQMIGAYLAGAGTGSGGAIAYGTCKENVLADDYDFNQGI